MATTEEVRKDEVDMVMENLLNVPENDKDAELENHQDARRVLLRGILEGDFTDKQVNAAKGLLSDMDKSILTRRRLEQDKEADNNTNQLLTELYKRMLVDGKDPSAFIPNVPTQEHKRGLGEADVSEFEFRDDETIIGNDTEASFEV